MKMILVEYYPIAIVHKLYLGMIIQIKLNVKNIKIISDKIVFMELHAKFVKINFLKFYLNIF